MQKLKQDLDEHCVCFDESEHWREDLANANQTMRAILDDVSGAFEYGKGGRTDAGTVKRASI